MDGRAAKRTRQACHTCRRKKTRCPGERPICSFCERLGQSCSYSEESTISLRTEESFSTERTNLAQGTQLQNSHSTAPMERMFSNLERKLDLVLGHILTDLPVQQSSSILEGDIMIREDREHQPHQGPSSQILPRVAPPYETNTSIESSETSNASVAMLYQPPLQASSQSQTYEEFWHNISHEVRSRLVQLYIEHCDCQPLPLLDTNRLAQHFETYSVAVQHLVLATALRFPLEHLGRDQQKSLISEKLSRGRRIIFDEIASGIVQISTLQALSLHAFVDLSSGNLQRARLDIGISLSLSRSSQLAVEPNNLDILELEERRRCYWALQLLKNLAIPNVEQIRLIDEQHLRFPESLALNFKYNTKVPDLASQSANHTHAEDLGIIGYSLQLIELWRKSLDYITRLRKTSEAAWEPNSDHFQLVEHIMEWESLLCKHHRYAHVRFAEQQSADITTDKRYWGPWFLVQFTYHGTLCLLNHPFIHFETARSPAETTASMITFLEKASDIALLHAKHITRLIDTLEQKNIHVSDPFFAYCATIAATIHLWFYYVEKHGAKEEARGRFIKCHRFILRLAKLWPLAQTLAKHLTILNAKAPRWKTLSTLPLPPSHIPDQDKNLLWDLLSYGSAINTAAASSNIFHPSLDPYQFAADVQNTACTGSRDIITHESPGTANTIILDESTHPQPSTVSPASCEPGSADPPLPVPDQQAIDLLFSSFTADGTGLDDFINYGIESQVGFANDRDDWFESHN